MKNRTVSRIRQLERLLSEAKRQIDDLGEAKHDMLSQWCTDAWMCSQIAHDHMVETAAINRQRAKWGRKITKLWATPDGQRLRAKRDWQEIQRRAVMECMFNDPIPF